MDTRLAEKTTIFIIAGEKFISILCSLSGQN